MCLAYGKETNGKSTYYVLLVYSIVGLSLPQTRNGIICHATAWHCPQRRRQKQARDCWPCRESAGRGAWPCGQGHRAASGDVTRSSVGIWTRSVGRKYSLPPLHKVEVRFGGSVATVLVARLHGGLEARSFAAQARAAFRLTGRIGRRRWHGARATTVHLLLQYG